jgi:hypothetical protein
MKKPVKVKDDQRSDLKKKYYKLIERDLLNEKDYIRHSPEKMCAVISDLIDGWIK